MSYSELAQQAVDGNINPLKVYIDLKTALDELQTAIATVQPLAIDEADKYSEKSFKAFGAVVEKRSTPATWDYSQVNAYQQARDRLKYIEKIAQAGGGADTVTGEEISKAVRIEGKASIAIKLVKAA